MRDELEKLLDEWVGDCCSCRSRHSSIHYATCPCAGIDSYALTKLYYDLLDWRDDEVAQALEDAMHGVVEPPIPVVEVDDPE